MIPLVVALWEHAGFGGRKRRIIKGRYRPDLGRLDGDSVRFEADDTT